MDTKACFKFLFPYLKRYKGDYSILLFFIITGMLLNIVIAWFFQNMTNALTSDTYRDLLYFFILGVVIIFAMVISNYMNTYFVSKTTNKVKRDVRTDMYERLIRFPTSFFDSTHSGDIQARIHQDTEQINGVMGHQLIQLFILPLTGLISFLYLAFIHVPLACIALILGPAILLISKVFGYTIRHNSMEIQKNLAKLTQHLQETIAGQMIVNVFKLDRIVTKQYDKYNAQLLQSQIREGKLSGGLQALSIGISYCSQIIVFAVGCFFVVNEQITIGDLLAFIALAQNLITPFTNVGQLWSSLQRSLAAIERIVHFISTPVEKIVEYGDVEQVPVRIEFKNVSFSYDNKKKALNNIHVTFTPGQKIAVIGESGSGKSTLIKLLLGLLRPTAGRIVIHPDLQQSFVLNGLNPYTSYVPQDHFLFDDTIYQNILHGETRMNEINVYEAAKMANAHEFIQDLPAQYLFKVGERGSKLSGGQRQRITLARAFIGDRSVLVLDEATSALDVKSEDTIMAELNHLRKEQIVIMITHRLSTARQCDMILLMKNGTIVATGTHEELLHHDNDYRSLFEREGSDQNVSGVIRKA